MHPDEANQQSTQIDGLLPPSHTRTPLWSVHVEGGVVARYMGSGSAAYGIAPAATARYDFGPATVYVRGLYRVAGWRHNWPSNILGENREIRSRGCFDPL